MPDRRSQRNHRLRQEIAVEAARVIATEGQRSYLVAKQKAAQRLGASIRNGLPSNSEVEEALRQWQHIYGGQAHEDHLLNLRQAAASAMRFLSPFRPRLVGPVAEGTADQYSRICLQVFADNPDDIVHFLMEHHVRFQQERRRVRWHDGDYRHIDILIIDNKKGVVELAMMIGRDALQALPSPIDGKPQLRMALDEVEELISPIANL